MRMVCWQTDDSQEICIIPYFFLKLGKMLKNLSSAAVVIGALRVNPKHFQFNFFFF